MAITHNGVLQARGGYFFGNLVGGGDASGGLVTLRFPLPDIFCPETLQMSLEMAGAGSGGQTVLVDIINATTGGVYLTLGTGVLPALVATIGAVYFIQPQPVEIRGFQGQDFQDPYLRAIFSANIAVCSYAFRVLGQLNDYTEELKRRQGVL